MRKNNSILWILPLLIVVFVFSITPLIMSLKDAFISETGSINLENFSKVYNDPLFVKSILNSILFSLVPLLGMPLAIYCSLALVGLSNNIIRRGTVSVIFLQYMFLGLAIGTGYMCFFSDEYGLLNMILSSMGIEKIEFINNKNYSTFFIMFLNIITSMPFLITSFTFRGVLYIKDKEALIATNLINVNSFRIYKSITLNMIGFISLIAYFEIIGGFLSYPIGLYSGDLSAVFVANSETMVCYINRAIGFGNYENAAVCSITCIMFVSVISILFGVLYKLFRMRGDKHVL